MGRLLSALRANSEISPAANLANLRISEQSRPPRFADSRDSQGGSRKENSKPLYFGWRDWQVTHSDGAIVRQFEPEGVSREQLLAATGAIAATDVSRNSRLATPDEALELRRLVGLVFVEDGVDAVQEALEAGLRDAERSIAFYRLRAAELAIGNPHDTAASIR